MNYFRHVPSTLEQICDHHTEHLIASAHLYEVNRVVSERCMATACSRGHLNIVKWLHRHIVLSRCHLRIALANSHLELVTYILTLIQPQFEEVYLACRGGHFEIGWIMYRTLENEVSHDRFMDITSTLTENNDKPPVDSLIRACYYPSKLFYYLISRVHITPTVLEIACRLNRLYFVRMLTGFGITSKYALEIASRHNHTEVIAHLLSLNINYANGSKILISACKNRQYKVIDYVRARGVPWTSQTADIACGRGYLDVVERMYHDDCGIFKANAINQACKYNYVEVVKFLYHHGIKPTKIGRYWARNNRTLVL